MLRTAYPMGEWIPLPCGNPVGVKLVEDIEYTARFGGRPPSGITASYISSNNPARGKGSVSKGDFLKARQRNVSKLSLAISLAERESVMARPVSAHRRRYSDEFKIRAVQFASHPGVHVQDVAAVLNVHPYMLSRWKREYREGRLRATTLNFPVKTVRKQVQLRRLERQMKALKSKIGHLKKADHLVMGRRRKLSPKKVAAALNS
jgi:transposase